MGLHSRETIARVRLEGAQLPAASMSSKTSKARGATLHVDLTCPQAPQGTEANITRVKVDLPKQLPSRLTPLTYHRSIRVATEIITPSVASASVSAPTTALAGRELIHASTPLSTQAPTTKETR